MLAYTNTRIYVHTLLFRANICLQKPDKPSKKKHYSEVFSTVLYLLLTSSFTYHVYVYP